MAGSAVYECQRRPVLATLLALTIVLQTIAGYPYPWTDRPRRHLPNQSPDRGGSVPTRHRNGEFSGGANQSDEVSRLIDAAMRNGELLDRDQFRQSARLDAAKPLISAVQRVEVKKPTADGAIVFPSDDMENGAPSCKGSSFATFCEKTPNYPRKNIAMAVRANENLKYLSGVDVLSSEVTDVNQRFGAGDDTPLCISTETLVYPENATNRQNEFVLIVNVDEFKQGLRIETCKEANSECKVDAFGGFAVGYTTNCKQKYIYRELATFENNSIRKDTFRIPSGCCCQVHFNPTAASTRMGTSSKMSPARRRKK